MKRFVLKIILFAIVIVVIDVCFGQVCDYLNAHARSGVTRQLYDLFAKSEHDILVMGSSRAHHSYVPEILEQALHGDCYNAGYDGNGIILAYPILSNIVERKVPKLVIFEVSRSFDIIEYAPDRNNTRYISKLKPYYRTPVVSEVIKAVSVNDYIEVHSSMYRYNSYFIHLLMDYALDMSMFPKGYQALNGQFDGKKRTPLYETEKNDELKLSYLDKMAQLADERQLNMVWVVSPQFYKDAEGHEDYEPAKAIAAAHHIPFLDYYTDADFVGRNELFQDATHMNDTGARLFSSKVAGDIKALFDTQ